MPQPDARLALQFLAAPKSLSQARGGWPEPELLPVRAVFSGDIEVGAHRGLSVTHHSSPERELLCLGTILDPRAPSKTDAEVVGSLLELGSFAELERALDRFGGRWLLWARFDAQRRIYTDAAGLRCCFHGQSPSGVVAASQPRLVADLLGVSPSIDPREGLARSAFADVYPLTLSPFPGVKQLPPNHYLELGSDQHHRYWPRGPVAHRTLDEAAQGIAGLLRGSVQALASRGKPLVLPLTGGYDSRTLLAAGWSLRQELDCLTVVDVASPVYDVVLPMRLSRAGGLKHRFVWGSETTPAQLALAIENTGGCWRDPNELRVGAFASAAGRVSMFANLSEVIRGGYFEAGNDPPTVDADLLARLAGWEYDAAALEVCRAWLDAAPEYDNITRLELYFWEMCMGGWSALDCLATDAFTEVASPYNCRELLTLGLGVPRSERCVVPGAPERSCLLHRRICQVAAPATVSVPFNDGWLGRVVPYLRTRLPPPLRGVLKRLRNAARALLRVSPLLIEPLTLQLWY